MSGLIDAVKQAIAQRKATAEQAQQQARSELHRILARSAKPKGGDDVQLLKLADDLNITPESLAQMVEIALQASELLAASDDARLKKLARAAVAAGVPVDEFNSETKRIMDERQSKLAELEQSQRSASAEFSRGQDSLKALTELANGEHAQLLRDVFNVDADKLPKSYEYYLGALNERDGKPW